jgi:hypothetical protein
MEKTTYTAWAGNEEGASTNVANGEEFTSINNAAAAARAEFAEGWTIHIVDQNGSEVKSFTIRK